MSGEGAWRFGVSSSCGCSDEFGGYGLLPIGPRDFRSLRRIEPGKGGELQLTDAIDPLISEVHPVHVIVHDGIRHDLGKPVGFIPASVEFGLRHPNYGPALFHDLEAIMENYRLERD